MVEHWPKGLQIGLPNLMVSFFQPWGHTSQKVQHLLIIWGKLKSAFLCHPWQDAKHPK
jgi:hypothetical protein